MFNKSTSIPLIRDLFRFHSPSKWILALHISALILKLTALKGSLHLYWPVRQLIQSVWLRLFDHGSFSTNHTACFIAAFILSRRSGSIACWLFFQHFLLFSNENHLIHICVRSVSNVSLVYEFNLSFRVIRRGFITKSYYSKVLRKEYRVSKLVLPETWSKI